MLIHVSWIDQLNYNCSARRLSYSYLYVYLVYTYTADTEHDIYMYSVNIDIVCYNTTTFGDDTAIPQLELDVRHQTQYGPFSASQGLKLCLHQYEHSCRTLGVELNLFASNGISTQQAEFTVWRDGVLVDYDYDFVTSTLANYASDPWLLYWANGYVKWGKLV